MFLGPMPYQMKILTTTAVNTAASMRAKTVSANPVIPVTTFAVRHLEYTKEYYASNCRSDKPEINILLKLSDRLFNAPAI